MAFEETPSPIEKIKVHVGAEANRSNEKSIAAGYKCRSTTSRFGGYNLGIKRSMKDITGSTIAKLATIPKSMGKRKQPNKWWRRIVSSNAMRHFAAF